MSLSLRYSLVLLCLFCASISFSQSEERYTVVVNLYQPLAQTESELLEEILVAQLEYYLLSTAKWNDNQISFSNSPKKFVSKLDELVKNDVKFNQYEALKDFKGFSETVKKKVENITSRSYNFDPISLTSQKSTLLNHQLSELLAILKTELMVFGEKDVYQADSEVYSNLTLEEKDAIIKEIEEYKEGDFLSPLDIDYLELLEEDSSGGYLGEPAQKELSDKILDLLAENAQRLERLESELIQIQIAGGSSISGAGGFAAQKQDLNLLKLLPESMNFYFYSGSAQLTTSTLLQLNEIVEILARSERIKIVITGFTDSVGSPETNLYLSKKRALAVKAFMTESGMSTDRFITNYYGESKSGGKRNEDRRVEIKFHI